MGGQLRLLNIACAAKARPRNVVLNRAKRDEILHFSVLGGIERNCGLFISKVEKKSKAHEAGLKRGDQVKGRASADHIKINSWFCLTLAPGRFEWNYRYIIFK